MCMVLGGRIFAMPPNVCSNSSDAGFDAALSFFHCCHGGRAACLLLQMLSVVDMMCWLLLDDLMVSRLRVLFEYFTVCSGLNLDG